MFQKSMIVIICAFILGIYNTVGNNEPNGNNVMHNMHTNNKARSAAPKMYYEEEEETKDYWIKQAQSTLQEKLAKPPLTGFAKNVIMFIGDGMSIPTLTAARTYLGQQNGKPGEESQLSFEKFPFSGLSKTYCVNKQVADSACSATAYLCGVKSNEATLGVTAAVKLGDCKAMVNSSNQVQSIAWWSQQHGKRTGLVTTATVTDASPAGLYAHTAQRDWQNDVDVTSAGFRPKDCHDIATQLIHGETGWNLNLILGGGRGQFLPKTHKDEEGETGNREDGRNLINEWEVIKGERKHRYVYNKTGLLDVLLDTKFVLGLFEKGDMAYNLDRDPVGKPSLAEMTEVAIKLLGEGDDGFFLFVEGGRIDHAHHVNQARRALDETLELHKAVQVAVDLTQVEDTLIVVTSDHAHTMSLSGYPDRGNDILGVAGMGDDDLPYSTISYANGLGYRQEENGQRHDIYNDDLNDNDYRYPALVPRDSETHGGDDVAIFARGPWSHLLSGVVQQNFIPHVMAYASCVGEGVTACDF